ncbi:hypothetical protein HPT27_11940 [Permianibacter sp. IMCC34836]|uniref:hypothetical protein n=1 Tax=Permianibacter fluminis TaxID=2738515 RepID=UPI0015516F45|nr:hypothetical protein [Permianibacter fluminis]NQD37738.1 hypothetical protein [Permianibacter fluminis]
MGLDWNPIGKPKPGHEKEFERLFNLLGDKPVSTSLRDRIAGIFRRFDREAATERFFEIQISPFITLGAPQVGIDKRADEWAKDRYRESPPESKSETQFLEELEGYYVAAIAPECDGLPFYSNGSLGYVEPYSFRAQFLTIDCEDILGSELIERCYTSCLAAELASLGAELRAVANSYATKHEVSHVAEIRTIEAPDDSPESKAHIMFSAAKWCEYWSSRGHGLEAYF